MLLIVNNSEYKSFDEACRKLDKGGFCGEKCDICFINFVLANSENISCGDVRYDLEDRVNVISRRGKEIDDGL